MKEKKDQYIVAYLADFEQTETAVSYAVYLSRMLQKGLILMHICDPRYSRYTTEEAEKKLQRMQKELTECTLHESPAKGVTITYAALKGDTRKVISALPVWVGAVAVVAQVDPQAHGRNPLSRKSLLHNFADCKTAFLVAQEPLENPDRMKDVAMAVDFKKESKDKMIWSSYFPRFGKCRMHVLYYDYKDDFLRNKWYANMTQLHKLYNSVNCSFQPHILPSKSTFLDVNALRYADAAQFGLLISVTTKEKDGLEFFIGVQEQRTIANRYKIPILFLNPREDLYVLCD